MSTWKEKLMNWNYGSKRHLTNQCVYFAFTTIVHLGCFCQKTCFHKKEFSNEIFWNFFIIIYICPNMPYFFCNQFWINMNSKKCTNFVRFCVSFWKNCHNFKSYQKHVNIFNFNFLYYKLHFFFKQFIHCITFTFIKNFFKTLNFDKQFFYETWKF
jgi:hypothetical protein